MASLTDILGLTAFGYAQEKGLRVLAVSSITPETTVYDPRSTKQSIADALGIRYNVRIIDESGNVLASFGDPSARFDPVQAALLWGALVGAVWLIGLPLVRRLAR